MVTKRTPITRQFKVQVTPEAIAIYRRMRSWDNQHTCPKEDPPHPGRIFNSADPEHEERQRVYEAERDAYEAAREACPACAATMADHAELLRVLGIRLRPWQLGLEAFPDIEAALEAECPEKPPDATC
jgi:ribosomal protein S27AE